MTNTRTTRLALLAACLAAAVFMSSTDGRVSAQPSGREDSVVRIAGKNLRVDKSGKLRPITMAEARATIQAIETMTERAEVSTTRTAAAGTLVQLAGFDHVLVGRPNGDGTTDVRCVGSVDEAIAFFEQQSAAQGQE